MLVRNDNVKGRRVGEQESGERDARSAPTNCAAMNQTAEDGSMPAKVSVRVRPMVTAGLAKLVEEVNQYAAAM